MSAASKSRFCFLACASAQNRCLTTQKYFRCFRIYAPSSGSKTHGVAVRSFCASFKPSCSTGDGRGGGIDGLVVGRRNTEFQIRPLRTWSITQFTRFARSRTNLFSRRRSQDNGILKRDVRPLVAESRNVECPDADVARGTAKHQT